MEAFWNTITNDPDLRAIYQVVRGIIIFLDLALVAIMIYSLRQLIKFRPKLVYDPRKWRKHLKTSKKKKIKLSTPEISAAWAKVQKKAQEADSDSLRLAVIEADAVLDEVLKRMHLPGESLADRMGNLKPSQYANIDDLWSAHRLRNNLIHTPDFELATAKAEEAIAAYEAFLKKFSVI